MKFALPSHTIVARKTRCYNTFVSMRAGRGEGWIDRDSKEFIAENRSVSLSLEIENEPRSLEVETLFSGSRSSPKVIINSGKRNEVLLPRHTSKNEIQLRGLTYSGVSKRGRPILLADLPRVIIFESVPWNRTEFELETCLFPRVFQPRVVQNNRVTFLSCDFREN